MTHEDIIERAAESIMQRANDTYPRTLHKDMLRDEIGKAIKEAIQLWQPPPVVVGLEMDSVSAADICGDRKSRAAALQNKILDDVVPSSHFRASSSLFRPPPAPTRFGTPRQ